MLFNLALEAAVRRAGIERERTLINGSYQILAYADDINLMERSIKSVKEVFYKLEQEAQNLGLKVNEEKTKFMVVSTKKQHGES